MFFIAPLVYILLRDSRSLRTIRIPPDTPTQSASLYQRLGGRPAIQAVVNDFIWRVGADGRIKARGSDWLGRYTSSTSVNVS